jgi:hypothetical protein
VLQARQIEVPDWAQVLVSAPGGPLVFAGETGRRGWPSPSTCTTGSPLQVAFPILLANLVNDLLQSSPIDPTVQAVGLQPETGWISGGAGASAVEITTPSAGQSRSRQGGTDLFTGTSELGLYRVKYLSDSSSDTFSSEEDRFAVNLFSPLESDLSVADEIQTGDTRVPAAVPAELGQRELWPWLAALALAVLMLEWWVYHRRQGLMAGWPARLLKSLRRA